MIHEASIAPALELIYARESKGYEAALVQLPEIEGYVQP